MRSTLVSSEELSSSCSEARLKREDYVFLKDLKHLQKIFEKYQYQWFHELWLVLLTLVLLCKDFCEQHVLRIVSPRLNY